MTSKLQSYIRFLRDGIVAIIIPIFFALILRVFFFEIYEISSISMEPTLVPGDYILVSKMSYGARLLRLRKIFFEKKIEYMRTMRWGEIKKGDVFVFNFPRYQTLNDSFPNMYGSCIVKRCFGMPRDTVIIQKSERKELNMKNEGVLEPNPDLFPHDSTLIWRLDNYGPLYVPAKGQSINLTKKNTYRYRDVFRYENPLSKIEDSVLYINNLPVYSYTFQHNYYFMVGDNFYGSLDSRYWGFVPDANIIGKAVVILFSIDPHENSLKKITWKRFFKSI